MLFRFFLSLIVVCKIVRGEYVQKYFNKKAGKYVTEDIKSITTSSEMECLVLCFDEACAFVDYDKRTRLCRLGKGFNTSTTSPSDFAFYDVLEGRCFFLYRPCRSS